jgi:hypothetical protein
MNDEEFVTKRPRGAQPTPCSPRDPIHVKKKKKKCYTALTRLRRNEPLARERVQQGRTRGCHQPHFKRLERNERAEADHCPSATEVTWQAMKPVNRKRPAPDGGPKANKLSKVVKGFER